MFILFGHVSKCTCYAYGQIAFNQKQLTCNQKLLVRMANCVDQDHMVYFRRYVIWVRAVYSRVNMHILCRWSNQCLVESSKLRPKLLVWIADCVDPEQIVHFRSYAIWVRPFCLGVKNDHATNVVKSALSRKQPNCVKKYRLDGKLCRPRSNSAC